MIVQGNFLSASLRRRIGMMFLPVLMACLLFAFSASRLHAQEVGGVNGTVTDSTGASIDGATVTVTNRATRISNHAVTSSVGTYTITALSPGQYDVSIEATGFKKSQQTGVTVDIGKQSAVDFKLVPGAASETLHVDASAVSLNTQQPAIGTTFEPELIKTAPIEINGLARQIDNFVFLAPGVQGNSFMKNINGGVTMESEVEFNGIPDTPAETPGYQILINPPYEMVNEFRVDRATFGAQFGVAQGAVTYNMTSGTNRLHADAFEILRNQLFDSSGFFPSTFSRKTGQPAPPIDQQNNYGFTISGPVVIPKLYNGRNKTFFLFSSDWFKQNIAVNGFGTVPTPAMKTGDFSHFVDANGKLLVIYDPQTGQPFPGNVIPATRFSPLAASILPSIPDPDTPGIIFGQQANKLPAVLSEPINQHLWGYTLDHNFSDSQSIHWSHWRDARSTNGYGSFPIVLPSNEITSFISEPNLGTGFLLNYVRTVNRNLVVTAGAAWMAEINNDINAPVGANFPGVENASIFPFISFDGQNAITNFGPANGETVVINRKVGITLVNNWLWTKGRNTFNIGGEYRRAYQDLNSCGQCAGVFNFSQRSTSTPDQTDPNFGTYGSSFASFLLGEVDSGLRILVDETKLRNRDFSTYIQDDIKVNRRLTVNLGLRWDIMVPFTENNNNIVYLDETLPNPGAGNLPGAAVKFGHCPGCAGLERAAIHWGHIGPRLGFSYMVDPKTVVQGGFYLDFLDGGAYEFGDSKVGVSYDSVLAGEFTRNSTQSSTPGYGNWDANPMPKPPAATLTPAIGIGSQIHPFDPQKDGLAPYNQSWNINVQRQLPWNIFLTAAYVGNRDIHLPSQLNPPNQLNPSALQKYGPILSELVNSPDAVAAGIQVPYPGFLTQYGGAATVQQALLPFPQYSSIIKNYDMAGTSFYNALQVQGEKRFSNGLSYLATLTLARNMGNVNSGFSEFASLPLNRYNQRAEYTVSTLDQLYGTKVAATYELPIGPGKKFLNSKGALGQIAGGWQVSTILDYEGGTPFGASEPFNPVGNGFDRPNIVPNVKLKTFSYKRTKDYLTGKTPGAMAPIQFTTNAFAKTGSRELGNGVAQYPELRNPPSRNENFAAMKYFHFTDILVGTLRMDYFNAFNRAQIFGPDPNALDATFGQVTNRSQANSNRQGQLTFRLEF